MWNSMSSTPWIKAKKCEGIIGLWEKDILDNFKNQNQRKKNFWIPSLSFLGQSWHAPTSQAWLTAWLVLVRWHLERPMYDFKNSFPMVLSTFIKQYIFFWAWFHSVPGKAPTSLYQYRIIRGVPYVLLLPYTRKPVKIFFKEQEKFHVCAIDTLTYSEWTLRLPMH